MTIPGLLVAWFVLMFVPNTKAHKNGFSFIIEVGGNWGGLELGAVALCGHYYGTDYWEEISAHEFGHSLWHQNILMGPFFIFIVAIPSAIRYWYQRISENKYHKVFDIEWYNKFWAEKDATTQGLKWKKLLGQVDPNYKIYYPSYTIE